MLFIGEIAAITTAFLWSINAVFLAEAAKRIGNILINITRMFLASIMLIVTILIIGADFSISQTQFTFLVLSGVVGLIIGDTALFKSFELIGVRIAMLIMSFAPPISAILAFIFLGEVITLTAIIGIFFTILGVGIVVMEKNLSQNDSKINIKGILFGIIASLGQAVGLIFAKEAFNIAPINEFVVAFVRLSSSTIIMYIIFRLSGKIKNPIRIFRNDKTAFYLAIVASILGPFLGITMSMFAISHTYVGIAATLISTVPIIMLPISAFYYKEKLSSKSIIGAIVAVSGVALLFL